MDIEKLLDNINRTKQHGDSIRISRIVNAERAKRGADRLISSSYVNLMLNNKRTMTKEVAEIADKYFKAQEEITKNLSYEVKN